MFTPYTANPIERLTEKKKKYDIMLKKRNYLTERCFMLRKSSSLLRRLGFYHHQPTRHIINTAGAVNYLSPNVLLLFCHPFEEKTSKRENNVWGMLSKLSKTDPKEEQERIHKAVAKTLQNINYLSPWETSRCDLIKKYIEDCEQNGITPKYSTYYGLKNTEFPACIISAIKEDHAALEQFSCENSKNKR